MKLGMTQKDIIDYFKKDKESGSYYNNVIKKYPEEMNDFIEKLTTIDIKHIDDKTITLKELQDFALELVVQRLRQLSCFGNPTKEYVKKVFEDTLKDIY